MSDTQTGNHNHNPDGSQRLAEQFEAVGLQILRNARNELYLNTRFLDLALSSLKLQITTEIAGIGTDGFALRGTSQDPGGSV